MLPAVEIVLMKRRSSEKGLEFIYADQEAILQWKLFDIREIFPSISYFRHEFAHKMQ